MRIIYAGYRLWSYRILNKLLKYNKHKWEITTTITPLKSEANFKKLPITNLTIDPNTLNNKYLLKQIHQLNPQVFLFFGWSWYIPQEIYSKYRCLILHPSPLPKYRGGSPLQHQILAGEEESAISIIDAVKQMDSGDLYCQEKISLEGNMNQIFNRIISVGTKVTKKLLDEISEGRVQKIPQDNNLATEFKRRRKEESELTIDDFRNKTSKELYNFIRALSSPYPNAYLKCCDGKKLFFLGAKLEE